MQQMIIRSAHHQMPQIITCKPCLRALTRTLSGLGRRIPHRCSPRNSTLRRRNRLHSPNTPWPLFASTISPWGKRLLPSSPSLYFVLRVSSAILQLLQLQTSGPGERSQLLWGVSRVHHREIQAGGILETRRGSGDGNVTHIPKALPECVITSLQTWVCYSRGEMHIYFFLVISCCPLHHL